MTCLVERGARRDRDVAAAVFFGVALLIAGSSEALACRDAKTGKVVTVENPRYAKEQIGQYAFRDDGSGRLTLLILGSSSPSTTLNFGLPSQSQTLHFCVDLELPTPLGADAEIGLYFWGSDSSWYAFETREQRFQVQHSVFGTTHSIAFWRPFPGVDKDVARMREIEFEATASGANIKIDGLLVTDFVARPPGGDLQYGLIFRAKDKSTVLRFAKPIVFDR